MCPGGWKKKNSKTTEKQRWVNSEQISTLYQIWWMDTLNKVRSSLYLFIYFSFPQHHQHQWGGMFLTLSEAAAAVKATRSSAPHKAQRRHQAAWSGGTDLPPGGGEAAGRGKEWCLRSGLLLREDLLVAFELGSDQRTWTWSRQYRSRSGREETSAEPRRKVKWGGRWLFASQSE